MRKIIFLIVLAIGMSACISEEKEEDRLYLLFASPLAEHDIWLQAKEGFLDACEEYNIHGIWEGPTTIDLESMEDVIETGIIQKADGIITQGVISQEIVEYAKEKEIPIIFVDSNVEGSNPLHYMGKDFTKQAQLLLDHIAHNVNDDVKLKIAIQVANLDFKIAQDQIKEVENVFRKHPGGYEIIAISQSLSEDVRAKREWEYVFEQHNDINVAINFAAESAPFCYEVALANGMDDEVLIYGVDDTPRMLELIKEDKIEGCVVTSFYQYGYTGVELLYDYIINQKQPDDESTNLMIVDQTNVDNYRALNDGK